MICSTRQPQKQSPRKPADWLNPRRHRNCEKVIAYLSGQGGKVHFDGGVYFDLFEGEGLDTFQIDQGIGDLFTLGLVALSMIDGKQIVRLLGDDLDAVPAADPVPGRRARA